MQTAANNTGKLMPLEIPQVSDPEVAEAIANMDAAEQALRYQKSIALQLTEVNLKKAYNDLKDAIGKLDELLIARS